MSGKIGLLGYALCFILLNLSSVALSAPSSLKIKLIPPADFAKIQEASIVKMTDRSNGKVSFYLEQSVYLDLGEKKLTFVPVKYSPKEKGENGGTARCAVLIPDTTQGSLKVVDVIGVGNYEAVTCLQPIAVGSLDFINKKFGVLVLFDAESPNEKVKSAVVFAFNDQGELEFDEKKTIEIDGSGQGTTVKGAKKYFSTAH